MPFTRREFVVGALGATLVGCTSSQPADSGPRTTSTGTVEAVETTTGGTGPEDTATEDTAAEATAEPVPHVTTAPPVPVKSLVTRWAADPWARGSYSFLAVGATEDDRAQLATPISDILLLAGEHTFVDAPALTHGALLSGRAAAQHLIDLGDAKSVIVVGAGFAGLGAARMLADNGIETIVLEARDRIGGRAWTDSSLGFPVDLGASWIQGVDGNPMTELAAEAGARTVITGEDNAILFDADLKPVPDDERARIEASAADILDTADGAGEKGTSLQDTIDAAGGDAGSDPRTRSLIRDEIRRIIEHEFAAGLDQLDAAGWDEGKALVGEDVIFPEGFVQVVDHIAKGLDIRLGVAVERIETGDTVVVHVTGSDATETADAIVVTVPLGVLQADAIAFDPPLPDDYVTAIHALGMGVLDKVILEFPDVFWPDVDIISITRDDGHFLEWLNLAKYIGRPVLMGFTAADPARQLETLTDEEIVNDAVKMLHAALLPLGK
jgi:monoamine oxidase